MSDPNPYEPPRVNEPSPTRKIAKRTAGLAGMIILTPVAVGIAALISCEMTWPVVNLLPDGQYAAAFFVGWTVFLLPPVITLIGMLWLARRIYIYQADVDSRRRACELTTGQPCFAKSETRTRRFAIER